MSDWSCWGVVKMELEVSYDEICCEDGQAERRRGAPGCINGGGEAVGTDCVDRHIFFITRSSVFSTPEADRLRAHHASHPATANQDSYGGVAGQKVILHKHLQQLLTPVAGLRSTGRQVWVREEQALEAPQKGSWRIVGRQRAPVAL